MTSSSSTATTTTTTTARTSSRTTVTTARTTSTTTSSNTANSTSGALLILKPVSYDVLPNDEKEKLDRQYVHVSTQKYNGVDVAVDDFDFVAKAQAKHYYLCVFYTKSNAENVKLELRARASQKAQLATNGSKLFINTFYGERTLLKNKKQPLFCVGCRRDIQIEFNVNDNVELANAAAALRQHYLECMAVVDNGMQRWQTLVREFDAQLQERVRSIAIDGMKVQAASMKVQAARMPCGEKRDSLDECIVQVARNCRRAVPQPTLVAEFTSCSKLTSPYQWETELKSLTGSLNNNNNNDRKSTIDVAFKCLTEVVDSQFGTRALKYVDELSEEVGVTADHWATRALAHLHLVTYARRASHDKIVCDGYDGVSRERLVHCTVQAAMACARAICATASDAGANELPQVQSEERKKRAALFKKIMPFALLDRAFALYHVVWHHHQKTVEEFNWLDSAAAKALWNAKNTHEKPFGLREERGKQKIKGKRQPTAYGFMLKFIELNDKRSADWCKRMKEALVPLVWVQKVAPPEVYAVGAPSMPEMPARLHRVVANDDNSVALEPYPAKDSQSWVWCRALLLDNTHVIKTHANNNVSATNSTI